MGAAARAMQMAGALEAILDLSVAYANERIAFERAIAKFQAVQRNLAWLAGEVAVAIAAAGSAADAIANTPKFDEATFLEAASAKIRVGEAATEGAGIAHQVLGAIGFTKEHTLHRFTRRLWAWRDDFGNESAWAVKLGAMVAAKGADELWPMLAATVRNGHGTELTFDAIRLPRVPGAARRCARLPRQGDRGRHLRVRPEAASMAPMTRSSAARSAPRAGSA
jgi:alkylation response protein AidB-like acyl-CoA dehydrogenase